ncbi:CRAL/TRIO domain-containing protein [Piedraia hortae CBS 480.64]|uniref:CRAL/TRIO domain-containing protein n=1 Tax=Piedraia hortae CBS 480.64 TaxID=1314780 RepID=A0A6A7BRU5_9PEZI|nr:CRAL/TRIO domain-containing protein [Piedraia hortae CBS 480.64]
MATQQPGRPGNLTAEQTAKLKEMWTEIFELTSGTRSTRAVSDAASEEHTPKKGKRLSMFKKKDKSVEAEAGDNDKHGQNRVFKEALAQMSPAELREALWGMAKHDHPDALLLRFLRARKWDVSAALVMAVATLQWRRETQVDSDIMFKGEAGANDEFMTQLRMGKSFFHGIDRAGRPCCYVRVRLHRSGEQSDAALERFTVWTIETGRMLLRPPVDTATIVFDMTDFTLANMDYTPVKFMIKCFEANYPESLGQVLVYKSPWVFQGIWKVIRGWLDPVVAAKVHFVSKVSELEEYIPREHIMKELGGDEQFTYSYVEPNPGEDDQMRDADTKAKIEADRAALVTRFEDETKRWIAGDDAVQSERQTTATAMKDNYWRLDPYVRARSLYDRLGILRGKEVKWY